MPRIACNFELLDADTEPWVPTVRTLFREYASWLNVDLCFQGFEAELADLPGAYAPARGGAVLLARHADEPAGCVALRALDVGICEMKRLWVREAFRGSGLGSLLARAVLQRALEIGYDAMRLDTLARMDRARQLYAGLGFCEVPRYYDSPLADAIYLEKVLRP
jgi:putative acetyltransferase